MELIRTENIEKENRGWVVDKISAVKNGVELGYLKIEYIPDVEWNRWYKSILDFMVHIKGWCIGHRGPDVLGNLTTDKVKNMAWYLWSKEFEAYDNDLVQRLIKEVTDRYQGDFLSFERYHRNSPHPSYVLVPKEHCRKGVGTKLYLEAARWMDEKGLEFRASELQSDEAKALWNSFGRKGLTKQKGKFLYLKA